MRVHFFTHLLVSQMQQEAFLLSAWFHPPTLFWLKKGQLPKIHTYLVTSRQGISGAWCELLHIVWQPGLHQSWDAELPGLGRSPQVDQAPAHRHSATAACVCTGSGCVWVCIYKTGGLCMCRFVGSSAKACLETSVRPPRPAGVEASHCPLSGLPECFFGIGEGRILNSE